MRYAVIKNEVVENVIIMDNPGDYFDQSADLVSLVADERCAIGWAYDPEADPRFIETET
jgi:hypothetical protein